MVRLLLLVVPIFLGGCKAGEGDKCGKPEDCATGFQCGKDWTCFDPSKAEMRAKKAREAKEAMNSATHSLARVRELQTTLVKSLNDGDPKLGLSTWPTFDAFDKAWDCGKSLLRSRLKGNRRNSKNEPIKFKKMGLRVVDWKLDPKPVATNQFKVGDKHKGCTAKVEVSIRKYKVWMAMTAQKDKLPPGALKELERMPVNADTKDPNILKMPKMTRLHVIGQFGAGTEWYSFEYENLKKR